MLPLLDDGRWRPKSIALFLMPYKIRPAWQRKAAGKRYKERIKADPVRWAKYQANQTAYYKTRPWKVKIKAYQSLDKKRGYDTCTMKEAESVILGASCVYCGSDQGIGLDRKDNNQGHAIANVVSCCEKCNMILGDIPYEAKLLLADGLRNIHNAGLLDNWTIKTKRRNGNRH